MTAPTWDRREGNRGAPLGIRRFFYSPFCRSSPYDHISPLTSLFPLFLAPSFPGLLSGGRGRDTCRRSPRRDLSRFNFNRPIGESYGGTPLRFSTSYYPPDPVYFYSRPARHLNPIFALRTNTRGSYYFPPLRLRHLPCLRRRLSCILTGVL